MEKNDRILYEQLKTVFSTGKASYYVGVIIAAILAFVQWPVTSHTTISIWLVFLYLVYIVRIKLIYSFFKIERDTIDHHKWLKIHLVGATFSGVIWGAAGIYLFPEQSLPHQMLLALVLAGIISGNVGTQSAIFSGILLYNIPLAVPFCIKSITLGDQIHVIIGLMSFIFLSLMLYTGWLINGVTLSSFFANENLKEEIDERKRVEHALRESEEKYRQIVENANDIILSLSTDGEILYSSPNWKEILGHDLSNVTGKTLNSFLHPDDIDINNLMLRQSKINKQKVTHMELRLRHLDGTWKWHTANGSNIYDEKGNILGFTCILRDITSTKKTDEEKQKLIMELDETIDELQIAKDSAESATKLKDQYVSLVSHDLRTPLAGILGLAKLLLGKNISPDKKDEIIKRIVDMSDRLLEMINRLLDINRLQSGTVKLNLRMVDAYLLSAQAIGHLSYMADSKKIKLINDLKEKTFLQADPDLLAQVLQNLLSNAIKFCNAGDTVTIFQPENNPYVLAVSDTGIGINPNHLEDLFRHEVTTSKPGTNGEPGTGFGLPYSFDILKAHKGRLWVESKVDAGSTFFLELPRNGQSG
ncbi:MAG: PAS domain S-box protein [Nitrospinota bacterium]|nr:PAS domain S-box protein [Nitrospinota bacterium]